LTLTLTLALTREGEFRAEDRFRLIEFSWSTTTAGQWLRTVEGANRMVSGVNVQPDFSPWQFLMRG
jgi:hypothetical protein